MKRLVPLSILAVWMAAVALACDTSFPTIGPGKRLVVALLSTNTGTAEAPLPVSTVDSVSFVITITATLPDGSTDTSFNGYANLAVQPGVILDLDVANIPFTNGIGMYQGSPNITVPVLAAFGETHIVATDIGYVPVEPNRTFADGGADPPECSNGIDDNDNGLIDYPADPGCYAPNDDTEDFGTYAGGASPTIIFDLPRIALVRGYDPVNGGEGNATDFPNTQVDIKTGWTGGTSYNFSSMVIGLTSSGFYVQDLQDDMVSPPGYSGLFAYNFSTPTDMRVCDRVQVLSGEASDFYGFTELNYPTWQLEYWDPTQRQCLVPEPTVLGVSDVLNDNRMWQVEATLGRLLAEPGVTSLTVAAHFGPGDGVLVNGAWQFGPDQSNCDFDHNGKINYDDPNEGPCADACNGSSTGPPTDFQCSEYSQFASEDNFLLIQTNVATGAQARPQVNAASANLFNPQAYRGLAIKSFTGLISYFSGGSQFTFNARCDDDIISDPNGVPKTSDVACVHARTKAELNQHSQ